MLLPMMNVARPPTSLALKARPVFIGTIVAQCLLVVARFLIMDLWGGMLTLLVVLMGTFVISSSGGIDITYCLYYGLMCLVNGIFDIILCIERWMHVKYNFFTHHAPLMFNVASLVFIICPIIELAATILAAVIYMDSQEAESRMLLPYGHGFNPIDTADIGQNPEDRSNGQRRDQSFTPFVGRAHHL
mmetsp:Transcript_90653/g.143275  ORF Transcript_90653/g.143275 Transcript_90653/m.143275 type:complete len:188 (-) Transcript_90653:142-705(-)